MITFEMNKPAISFLDKPLIIGETTSLAQMEIWAKTQPQALTDEQLIRQKIAAIENPATVAQSQTEAKPDYTRVILLGVSGLLVIVLVVALMKK